MVAGIEKWWEWGPSGFPAPLADLDTFTKAYIEAALWSSNDEEGNPLDDEHDDSDIDLGTLKEMIRDAERFQRENAEDIGDENRQAGLDFWLTRNGHGAGFWDGDWPKPAATRLTKASRTFGEYGLYIGDDGKIYGMGG